MRLCNILFQYFLFIYFSYCHDLHHADQVTIKQSESSVTVDSLNKNIETTNVQNENDHDLKQSNHANEQQSPSITPSVDDITTSSILEQNSIPLVSDTIKNIPISNDPVQIQINPKFVNTIQQDRSKEDNSFTHTQSHIPSPSNSNPIDVKLTQTTTTSENLIVENESHPSRILRRQHPKPHIHPRHVQTEDISLLDDNQSENATVETSQPSVTIENKTQMNDQPMNHTDISNPKLNVSSTKEDLNKNEIENDTNAYLLRIFENETTSQTNDDNNNNNVTEIKSKVNGKNRQICWHLPKKFEPSIELLENQIFRFINILPEFLQTICFGRINDREILMNTIWFGSICSMCFLFSFLFLSMGTKRLKQSKYEKEVRTRCQQLQQYNNQIELERATFERQNQKLSDEIDELKNLPVRNNDEDVFTLRRECNRFQEDLKTARIERDILQQDIDHKQNLIKKYENDLKGQPEIVAYLNNQIIQLKQELEKERGIVNRLQSNNLSLENFEKSQEIIQDFKREIIELKQEKLSQQDQLQEIQEQSNQLDIENNQLTLRMKQLKDLLEQRDQTIKIITEKIQTIDHFESDDLLSILKENSSNQDFLSIIDYDIQKSNQHIHDLHSQIDEKTRRIKELEILFKQEKDHCKEIETKLKVILELREHDTHLHIRQLGQTSAELRKARTDRICSEITYHAPAILSRSYKGTLITRKGEDKEEKSGFRDPDGSDWIPGSAFFPLWEWVKNGQKTNHVIFEQLHTDRVRLLQQQLDLKQQQLDDIQKVLSYEQIKFNEECSKLQHDTHEKWMEVKRLTRELDTSKKECEGLRRQITKYANNERLLQEKTVVKPFPQNFGELERNSSSPIPYQQGENFRPIDQQRNDSGATSPADMFIPRPPLFGLSRPPFFPASFLPPPPPNPFIMHPRFPMPNPGPHGILSPISHLINNSNDANTSEIIDSSNSTSYDAVVSPVPNDEKPKKAKKSLKKKSQTSIIKENV